MKKHKPQLQIGSLNTKEPAAPPPAPEPAKEAETAEEPEPIDLLDPFGDLVPFADPSWYQGVSFFCFAL